MKKIFIYIAAVAMAMSCTDDIIETPGMGGDEAASSAETTFVTLNLDIEGGTSDTRVSVTPGENASDPWKTAWEEGDQIFVSSVEHEGYKVLTYSADSGFSGEVYLGENRIYYNGKIYLNYNTAYVDDSWVTDYSIISTSFEDLLFADGGKPLMVSSKVITVGGSDDDGDGVVTDVIDVTMQHMGTAIDFGMKFKNVTDGIFTPTITEIMLGGVPEGGDQSDYTSFSLAVYTDFYKGVDDDGFIIEYEYFSPDSFTASIPITESDTEYSIQFGCPSFTIEAGKKINVTLVFNNGLLDRSFDITNSGEAFTFARATHSTFQNSYDLTGLFDELPDTWLVDAIPFADTTSAGTAEDPIEITSEEELAYLSAIAYGFIADKTTEGVYYELTQDLDLAGKEWTPIGTSYNPFMGHFDGGNNTISNLTITPIDDYVYSYQGLFGVVGDDSQDTYYASISNLTMASVNINSSKIRYIGGVAGTAAYASISNCSVSGDISVNTYAGSIVGLVYDCDITGCNSSAAITISSNYVGGIVGYSTGSNISECYNTGDVKSTRSTAMYVGGVVSSANDGAITNCYNTGAVSSSGSYNGGVVGTTSTTISITNCYNTGDVSGSKVIGGIIGRYNLGTITVTSCFNVGEVTETDTYHTLGGIMGTLLDSYDGIVTESYYIVSDTTEFNNSGTQLTSVADLNAKVDGMNSAATTSGYTGATKFTAGTTSTELPMLGIGGAEPFTYGAASDPTEPYTDNGGFGAYE